MKKTLLLFTWIWLAVFILLPVQAQTATDIINIRHWTAPDNTRIVIDTASETTYAVLKEDRKLIIDIFESQPLPDVSEVYAIAQPAVRSVRVTTLSGRTTRIEIDIADHVSTHVFALAEILDKPHRIVIDATLPDVEKRDADERIRIGELDRQRIIVIDPGHGGEDPGAIGRMGTREKDIVLDIARHLKDILTRRGYQVFLTRNGDYFVSLVQRGVMARQYNADLFISIHADAAPSRDARGTSVYALSTIGASHEAARLLAASQNLSDIIGGDPDSENGEETDPILLNMLQTEAINQSRSFGLTTLNMLNRVNDLKFKTVQGAPFRVLKLPDIPSVLVETAYLSNPLEERLLRDKTFRQDIAWAIAASVTQFMPTPSSIAFLEDDSHYQPSTRALASALAQQDIRYTVRRGDHLDSIAARHGTTVASIMAANRIPSKNRIYVGQTLAIRGGHHPDESESAPAVYTVTRGDSLEHVARRYGVSVNDLMQLNNIRSKNRIFVGQQLAITPGPSTTPARRTTHVVARGENLEQIARRYGMSVDELISLNNVRSKNRIFVGQQLTLTPSRTGSTAANPTIHTVARGETLDGIARQYGTTVRDLMHLNQLPSANRIFVGQRLALSAAAAPRAVAKPPRTTHHTVARGETLEVIARRHGTTVHELMRINNLRSQNRIFAGQRLTLPNTRSVASATATHTVTRGETLASIARQYGTTVREIMRLNNLRSAHVIYPGQDLRLPGSAASG